MNKAEQLIACLEGEIAKRDARIVELERYQFAFNEWHDKTEWVQAESATLSAKYLGCHRADVMRSLIDGLRAELAALKAQGTVGEVVGWYRLDRPYEMTSYPSVCATWHKLGAPVAPLYAAPVSEAKAQGVVMPERAIKDGGKFSTELKVTGWNACLDEVARLNAAPAAPAADAGMVEALEKLARLGNGDKYGNSDGNLIAQAALAAHRTNGVV